MKGLTIHSAFFNPKTKERRLIYLLPSVRNRMSIDRFVVVKLFPQPGRYSVKWWGGTSLDETISRWNTNEPYMPSVHEDARAMELVKAISQA